MVDVGKLRQPDRIAIARLEGTAFRLTRTPRPDDGEPLDEIHAISRDPFLLGIAAGVLASHGEHDAAAVELLRQAGADMTVAAEQEREVREREARRGRPP